MACSITAEQSQGTNRKSRLADRRQHNSIETMKNIRLRHPKSEDF